MQLRYDTQLNVEEYISTKAWQKATLTVCPNHPKGGCSLARHGTYVRKCGNGQIAHIARWLCRKSHHFLVAAGLLCGAHAGHSAAA